MAAPDDMAAWLLDFEHTCLGNPYKLKWGREYSILFCTSLTSSLKAISELDRAFLQLAHGQGKILLKYTGIDTDIPQHTGSTNLHMQP